MAVNPNRPVNPTQPGSPAAQPAAAQDAARLDAEKTKTATAKTALRIDALQAQELIKGQTPAILKQALLPDQAQFEQARAKLQQGIDSDLALQDRSVPRRLYLRQNYQAQLLTQPGPSVKGSVIMLHGYTAGPWQFTEAAQRFHSAGYQVYVPRIPGHGMMHKDGTATGEQMVGPGQEHQYEKFIDQAYNEVAALGGPVHVVGLSGGAALALRMAEKHPQIKGVVAMAPFVGPSETARVANNVINSVAKHSFIKLPQLLDLVNYNKNIRSAPDYATPHTQGTFGNAQAMLSLGTRVDKVKVPVQFYSTAGDLLAGQEPVEKLFQRSGGEERNNLQHFPAEAKVPHAMASPRQFEGANKIWDQIFTSIEEGKF